MPQAATAEGGTHPIGIHSYFTHVCPRGRGSPYDVTSLTDSAWRGFLINADWLVSQETT